jgi:hypothetical protein
MSPAGDRLSGGAVDAVEYLASQSPELRVPDALERIRQKISESRLAVLDDDPTGTQTVHGVPVLTTWSIEDLRWALEQPSSTFYVLTNSRSFPEQEAAIMNREISRNLASAATQTGTGFAVVSRGDSTLRGHYPAETDALEEGLGPDFDGLILCPCYLEAGRLTVDDIHWVRQGESGGDGVRPRRQLRLLLIEPRRVGRGEDERPRPCLRGRKRGPCGHQGRRARAGL